MMRWLILLFLPFGAQATALPSAWQHWQYFRPLQVTAPSTGWMHVTLPPEIYGPAQTSLADLRLVDQDGKEVPYLLHAQQEQCQRTWRSAPLSDTGFTPGSHSQVVIDAGIDGLPHNAIEIATVLNDFFTWTEISASDDRITWRIVREKTPFYRFDSDKHVNGDILDYPLTRSRWLRLRFLQGGTALLVTGARITREIRIEAERIPLPASFQLVDRQPERESVWQTDLGRARPPVSAFHFETTQAEFHREVKIDASDDGKNWRSIAHGHISRHATQIEAKPQAALEIAFPETHARFWRIGILNRDDPALPELHAQMLTIPRHLAFKTVAGTEYRMIYGNPRARPAQYELAQASGRPDWQSAPLATLGTERVNPDYVSADPWSERHPWLLWTALIAAVGILAWMAIHALRHGDERL